MKYTSIFLKQSTKDRLNEIYYKKKLRKRIKSFDDLILILIRVYNEKRDELKTRNKK